MTNDWKKATLFQNATIKKALETLNTSSLRVVLIVDDNNLLQGVITDGDIRRGILNGISLDSCVDSIMNKKPITAQSSTEKKHLTLLMKKYNLLCIPILENKKLVGLETIHNTITNNLTYENPVFIMAGGFGTRLKPLTDTCPKPMLKIGNKPILETVIRNFIKAGFINFYISTHYMPEKIHEHFGDGSELGINITYIHETEPLGTGGALGLLPTKIMPNLPLIMINGDILTTVDILKLLDFHLQNSSDATMCVREYTFQIPYGVVKGENNHIVEIVEKPTYKHHVNAGIYVISPELIHSVEKNTYIDMPTLLENRLKNDKKILMFPIHEYWLDIGKI
ncbi:nucleotidyltransferase family protein, partial [Morganella morganii]|uniref:nucleotidyltransferase family protein n=1 Tax=Morganella morganii TaxID=582 RepID=UPI000D59E3C6